MRRTCLSACAAVLLLCLCGSAATEAHGLHAGKRPVPLKKVSIPNSSLMEWFSPQHANAGQSVTVFARAWIGNRPIAGAQLTALVIDGHRVLARVRGGQTGQSGQTQTVFKIPASVHHTTLTVYVTLSLNGRYLGGRNQLTVT